MPAPSERMAAFRNTVVYNLGAGAADDVRWNTRTTVPTRATLAPVRALAARRGWDIEAWLFNDGARTALEAAEDEQGLVLSSPWPHRDGPAKLWPQMWAAWT